MNDGDTTLLESGNRFLNWLSSEVLPAWKRIGFHSEKGYSFERLRSYDDATSGDTIRTRTQARQIYVFCVAKYFGWIDDADEQPGALQDFVDEYCRQDDGIGFIRSLSADLSERDRHHDLYDHACFLLAAAWKFRVFRSEGALQDARRIIAMLDDCFRHPGGGWREGDYSYEFRRQNPHLHLFEALLALSESTDEPCWLRRAGEIYWLFEERFYSPDSGLLLEYFNDDLQPANGAEGQVAEPGHMMEWVWLLRWYETLSGTATGNYADTLFTNALSIGRSRSGLLFDQIHMNGTVSCTRKRLWPMTEFIKAAIMQARSGMKDAGATAAAAIESLLTHFVDKAIGVPYCDQLDDQDFVIANFAAASSMYHLTATAYEIDAFMNSRPE